MKTDPLAREVLATWKRHQQILLFLLQRTPEKQLGATPTGSKGRDVARTFAHLNRNRLGWLHFHRTGERPDLPKSSRGERPKKKELAAALRTSGRAVEELLAGALRREARVRLFGKSPVRWMGYLIAHESHHRGQILVALKQSGFTFDEKVAVQGLWGKWIFGK
ncbi:MAG TPA: DinB family protein [Planctomycetota bacterium]